MKKSLLSLAMTLTICLTALAVTSCNKNADYISPSGIVIPAYNNPVVTLNTSAVNNQYGVNLLVNNVPVTVTPFVHSGGPLAPTLNATGIIVNPPYVPDGSGGFTTSGDFISSGYTLQMRVYIAELSYNGSGYVVTITAKMANSNAPNPATWVNSTGQSTPSAYGMPMPVNVSAVLSTQGVYYFTTTLP